MFLGRAFAGFAAVCFCSLYCLAQHPVPVGRLSGGDFRVRGQVEFGPDGSATLMSGAQIEIRSGTARVEIPGGSVRLCGGMRGSVLKSASASAERGDLDDRALLFAIDNGIVEVDYTGTAAHAVQTPYFSIATVPLAERQARAFAVRVDASGFTCVSASSGSLRVREQMGTAEMMIPTGRAMMIPASGVEKASAVDLASCGCPVIMAAPVSPGSAEPLADVARAQRAKAAPQAARRVYTNDDLAAGAAALAAPAPATPAVPPPDGIETKTTIAAAPLTFNAEEMAKAGPPKEAEVTLPVVTAAPPPLPSNGTEPAKQATAAALAPAAPAKAAKPHRGFGARLKSFFKALFGYK